MDKVLIVDDEPDIRNLIKDILEDEGYAAYTAASCAEAEQLLSTTPPDLMLLDIWMPDMDGITLLRRIAGDKITPYPIIVMSGHGTVETAVEATRLGAFDYVEKPLSTDKLLHSVRTALESRAPHNNMLRNKPIEELCIGKSAAVELLRQHMATLSGNNNHILLHGERGAGKELFAQNLHNNCHRKPLQFIAIQSDKLYTKDMQRSFEQNLNKDNAILFISNIEEFDTVTQKLLIRHIKKGAAAAHNQVSTARLVLATANAPSQIHPELYDCLRQQVIEIPSLHNRPEDIPVLLEYYATFHSTQNNVPYRHFSVASQNLLRHYSWPGNLRELRELSFTLLSSGQGGNIEPDEINQKLPAQIDTITKDRDDEYLQPLREARQQFERKYIMHHLRLTHYSISQVASRIGVDRTYLYKKMRDLGIKVRE